MHTFIYTYSSGYERKLKAYLNQLLKGFFESSLVQFLCQSNHGRQKFKLKIVRNLYAKVHTIELQWLEHFSNHVVVFVLFYDHDKHIRSCRDGQLT